MMYIIYLIIFGFILTTILGLIASWIDRKVTARIQYRVGPPFFQPFIDITKLIGKETVIPETASKGMFLISPVIGFAAVTVASTILWMNQLKLGESFLGDIIVILYLFTVPSLSIILGGLSSGNPLARVGASREMKLILSYELPFILCLLVPIIRSGFSIKLIKILEFQDNNGAISLSLSGGLALLILIPCIQAKLSLVPFDIAEAETEIMGGPIIEYSGVSLAIYKLMKSILLFCLPFFIIVLFLGGFNFKGWTILYSILKYIGILLIITVIRNTNPRIRIDHAMKFFWGPVTIGAVIAVVLALLGL